LVRFSSVRKLGTHTLRMIFSIVQDLINRKLAGKIRKK
jgi:hypothetical protein